MYPLPEGVEVSFQVYCTSDSTGIDIVVSLKGMKQLPVEAGLIDTAGILRSLPEADDWRVMTRDEITEYKANEKED